MEVKKIDKSNMRKTILDFPKQFQVGLKVAEDVGCPKDVRRPKAVLVCGMGGSALPADILNMWLEAQKSTLSVHIHSDYGLPYHVDKKHLVICIAYSGNTEETLTAFEEARRKNLKIAAITSDGRLAELCQKYKIPLAKIPAGFQPRMAIGFQFAALMKILANCQLIKNNLKNISNLENLLKPGLSENQGKKLAKKLKGGIPLIYTSEKLKALARIWKIKFNENSKIPAFYNYFPELNHNEMVGFTQNGEKRLHVIILKNSTDHSRNLKRMELTAEILKKKGVMVDIIDIKGYNILDKIFSSILLADWTSYYLALEYGVDPTPVKIVEEFKKNL